MLLTHGLWTNRVAMLYLAARLASHGYRTRAIGYFSALRSFAHNVARVRHAIATAAGSAIHLVGHSLGGVILLHALADLPHARVRRVVLLGAPLESSESGRQMTASWWGAPLLGTTRSLWRAMPKIRIPAGIEVGSIAGTRRLGLGELLLKLPPPHDGVVTVAETRHAQLADHIVLPVAHSQMLVSPLVARQIEAFLEHGRFAR